MVLIVKITDAAQKERAWFRRQKGYLRDEFTRDFVRCATRLDAIEVLLSGPASRAEPASDPGAHGVTHGDFLYHKSVLCAACAQLSQQRPDLSSATLGQIHNLHRLSEGIEE